MFLTYLRRELRRRRRAAFVISLGLALGIGLVLTVTSVTAGMQNAQSQVLHSLYGVGTDITVTKAAAADSGSGGPQSFGFKRSGTGTKSTSTDRLSAGPGAATLSSTQVSSIGSQQGVSAAVGGLALSDVKFTGSLNVQGGQSSSSSSSTGRAPGGAGGGSAAGGGAPNGSANVSLQSFTVDGVDTGNLALGPLSSSKITSGTTFTSADSDATVAVVDSAYAKSKSLAVGSTATVGGKSFKVIGIATASSGASTANIYIPLTEAQTLADMKGEVTTVYVQAASSTEIASVKSAIEKNVSGTTVTTSADLASQVTGSLSTAANLATSLGKWLSIAVLLAAFLISSLLTSAAVNRRIREFGTLKALGWRSRRVIGQVVGEAMVNGLIGGALGIALGLAGSFAISSFSPTLTASTGSASASTSGASGPGAGGGFGGGGGTSGGGGFGHAAKAVADTVSVHLTAPVTLTAVALAVALALAGGLTAGAFGGWRASRLRPADALRRVE